jgi:hypothetical protein
MKLIKAFIHHVRTAAVVEALTDAGYRNLTLLDVRGMLKPVTENAQERKCKRLLHGAHGAPHGFTNTFCDILLSPRDKPAGRGQLTRKFDCRSDNCHAPNERLITGWVSDPGRIARAKAGGARRTPCARCG